MINMNDFEKLYKTVKKHVEKETWMELGYMKISGLVDLGICVEYEVKNKALKETRTIHSRIPYEWFRGCCQNKDVRDSELPDSPKEKDHLIDQAIKLLEDFKNSQG